MTSIWTIARRHVALTVVLVVLLVSSGTVLAAALTTTALAAPTITQEPADATDSGRPKFKLGHPRKDVTFECSLDDADFTPCHKNIQYRDLPPGQHCFAAKAVDRTGQRSAEASRCWSNLERATFGITGTITQPFHPGRSIPLDLRLANANHQDIRVLAVTVTVERSTTKDGQINAACDGAENLRVSRELQGPITVPKRSTMSLSELGVDESDWPLLTMPNLSVNQDGCKGTQFHLSFSGEATK